MSRKKLGVIISATAVLLVILGVLFFMFIQGLNGSDATDDERVVEESSFAPQLAAPVVEAMDSASDAVNSGGVKAGVSVYDKAIADNDDPKIRYSLLIKKAELLSANGDNESAIKQVLRAQEVAGETHESTSMLAYLYEIVGDNSSSAEYFRKSAERVVKEAEGDDTIYNAEAEAAYYKEKADQLESS